MKFQNVLIVAKCVIIIVVTYPLIGCEQKRALNSNGFPKRAGETPKIEYWVENLGAMHEIKILKINKETFRGVMGESPFYVFLRTENQVVFFQNVENVTRFMCYDCNRCKVKSISGNWVGFGYGLNNPDELPKDLVSSNSDGRTLTISSRTAKLKQQCEVDIQSAKQLNLQTEYIAN